MKKILQISPYNFSHIGGVEKYAEILQKICNDKIITAYAPRDFNTVDIVKNCPVPIFWRKNFWGFIKKVKKNPPKAIISHIRFSPTAFFAFLLAKYLKIPYIHIEHGTGFLKHSNFGIEKVAKIIDLTIGKIIIKNADFVICASKNGEKWTKETFKRNNKITTIYRGFEIKNFNKKNENNEKIIGFVGRLVPLKNLKTLILVLKKLEKQKWKMKIIGDGEEKNNLEKLTKKLNISNKIEFLGSKDNNWILENFYPNIDIFVNPSLQEGLSTTVIEAKIAGCKVLSTDVGGTREIPDIYLTKPTKNEIYKNLKNILENNTNKKEVISKEFLEKFSLMKMKENYEKILKNYE